MVDKWYIKMYLNFRRRILKLEPLQLFVHPQWGILIVLRDCLAYFKDASNHLVQKSFHVDY